MLLNVAAPVLEFWKAAIAIAIVGVASPSATYAPNGSTPTHRTTARMTRGNPRRAGPRRQ